jgi:GNAT superfamily N-acetyltransferase
VPFALTADQLRRAVPELAALLASAGAGPAASAGPAGPLPAPDDAAGWWRARTPAVAGRAVEVLAVRDGGGAVCGAVEWRRAGPPGPVAGGGHRGEIGALLVRADVRRRGLGRLLLRTAQASAWADGVRLLLLDTWAGGAMECLCRAEGWTPLGTAPGHAPDPAGTARPVTFVKTLGERPR